MRENQEKGKKESWRVMTGNGIRDEGAKTVSEVLEINKSLKSLNLWSKGGKNNEKWKQW